MVPAEEQERETREGQAAEDAQQLQRAPSPDAAEEQQDEEQEEVELQQELNVVHGDEMALREELRAVESDLDEHSDAPLAAQAMAEEQSAQTANPFDDGGAVLIGDDHTSLELLLDSDAPEVQQEVQQEESVQRVKAQDAFDGSEWTLPPPPPPPPWLYHYADSDGNAILDSDGNAVNVRSPLADFWSSHHTSRAPHTLVVLRSSAFRTLLDHDLLFPQLVVGRTRPPTSHHLWTEGRCTQVVCTYL